MRQRTRGPVIVWAAILTSLLATSERATADGITVVVPVNITNLHEEVTDVYFALSFWFKDGGGKQHKVANGLTTFLPVVDGSVQQDAEFSMFPYDSANIFTATSYELRANIFTPTSASGCVPNEIYGEGSSNEYCNDAAWSKMQTYERMKGPISELVPE